ncbi:MAG: hypothetical protein ACKV2Q_10840, partial [Planctomycetaceae bacterium]
AEQELFKPSNHHDLGFVNTQWRSKATASGDERGERCESTFRNASRWESAERPAGSMPIGKTPNNLTSFCPPIILLTSGNQNDAWAE